MEHTEFLAAKRSVDDRALDRRVWDRFVSTLERKASRIERELRIVEFGAGIGSMVSRLAGWESLPGTVSYRALDIDAECIAVARDRLPEQLDEHGYTVTDREDRIVATAETGSDDRRIEIVCEIADALTVDPIGPVDAVVSAAFVDLTDLAVLVPHVESVLAPGGVWYAPCTFNGATTFTPRHPLDDRIERLYHRHMDDRRDGPGSSLAGQECLDTATEHGFEVVDAGGGDWLVWPREGAYPNQERAFLDGIVDTIDEALAEYPADVLDLADRKRWIETRRTQIERGACTFSAHNLDLLVRVNGTKTVKPST